MPPVDKISIPAFDNASAKVISPDLSDTEINARCIWRIEEDIFLHSKIFKNNPFMTKPLIISNWFVIKIFDFFLRPSN